MRRSTAGLLGSVGVAGSLLVALGLSAAAPMPALGDTSPTTSAPPGTAVSRIAGRDRIETAIGVSNVAFQANGSAQVVVLSRWDGFADALAGTPLAVAKVGPILLTPGDALDARTEFELKRVLPAGATVYVLGGEAAISDPVATQVTKDGYTVKRLGGNNRFATAVKVAQEVGTPATILLATGNNPGDALASGAAAAKINGVVVLSNDATMPPETAAYLSANGSVPVDAVGGQAAAADRSATPVVGADRFATSVAVAQKFFSNPTAVGIANGFAFPDALSGGPAVGQLGGPLVLVDYVHLPQSIHDYLVSVHSTIQIAELYGGESVVTSGEESALNGALRGT